MNYLVSQDEWERTRREMGRIEKMIFILDYISSASMRRRIQKGLNKGEAMNAFARAVFFGKRFIEASAIGRAGGALINFGTDAHYLESAFACRDGYLAALFAKKGMSYHAVGYRWPHS